MIVMGTLVNLTPTGSVVYDPNAGNTLGLQSGTTTITRTPCELYDNAVRIGQSAAVIAALKAKCEASRIAGGGSLERARTVLGPQGTAVAVAAPAPPPPAPRPAPASTLDMKTKIAIGVGVALVGLIVVKKMKG